MIRAGIPESPAAALGLDKVGRADLYRDPLVAGRVREWCSSLNPETTFIFGLVVEAGGVRGHGRHACRSLDVSGQPLLEEGGKEGKRGPFRCQNVCGSRVAGGRKAQIPKIGGRGSEASTEGQVGEKNKKKNHALYSSSATNGKPPKKGLCKPFFLCRSEEGLGRTGKITEKGIVQTRFVV